MNKGFRSATDRIVESLFEASPFFATANGVHHFDHLLDRYDANVVVWQLLTLDFGPLQVHPFTEFLLRSGEWRLVFYDGPDPRHPERPSAVSAVFLFRFATYWLPVPPAWLALQGLRKQELV